MALEQEENRDASATDLAEKVAQAVACRARLGIDGDAATRLARSLAYDVVLIRLCEQIGLPHDMLGARAGSFARQETERQLVSRLPSLAVVLEGLEPGDEIRHGSF